MIRISLLLFLALLAAAAEPKLVPRAAPVTLYTHFLHTADPATVEALQSEVTTILKPTGIDFEWRQIESNTGGEVSVELVVVSFEGDCNAAHSVKRGATTGALGWTHVSNGEVLPFTNIDCDKVHRLLKRPLAQRDARARSLVYGRALGRVLAHELYHVLARTARHGECGISKPYYTAQELMDPGFRFDQRAVRAIETSPAHAALVRAAFRTKP